MEGPRPRSSHLTGSSTFFLGLVTESTGCEAVLGPTQRRVYTGLDPFGAFLLIQPLKALQNVIIHPFTPIQVLMSIPSAGIGE